MDSDFHMFPFLACISTELCTCYLASVRPFIIAAPPIVVDRSMRSVNCTLESGGRSVSHFDEYMETRLSDISGTALDAGSTASSPISHRRRAWRFIPHDQAEGHRASSLI